MSAEPNVAGQLGALVEAVGGLKEDFVEVKEELREIRKQTTAHNGRMTKLERINAEEAAVKKALLERDTSARRDRNFFIENWKWTIGTLLTFIGLLIAGLAFVMGGH